MRIKKLLAIVGLCLAGLAGNAWAEAKDDGSKRCLKCHDEEAGWMSKSPHANTDDARVPTCMDCHGESAGHVKASSKVSPDRRFKGAKGLPSAEASAVCLSCHEKDPKRALWAGSTHPNSDVACNNCHVVHNKGQDKVLNKITQPDVCFTCHKDQRTKANLPSHHPIPEGKMTCADCHNVHGSAGAKLVKRDNTNDTCYTCHPEKRGPFVHNHEPVQDDCATCHNPHGSTIAAMLKSRPPILCQQCHTPHVGAGVGALGGQPGVFPPPVGGQSSSAVTATSTAKNVVNFWQGRSCLNCHTQIHGSNNPAATNPTPQLFVR
jgi:DmsE family decaheme c-type cytochrome